MSAPKGPGASWANATGRRKRRGEVSPAARTHLKRFRSAIDRGFAQARVERQQKGPRGPDSTALDRCPDCGLFVGNTAAARKRHAARLGCKLMLD